MIIENTHKILHALPFLIPFLLCKEVAFSYFYSYAFDMFTDKFKYMLI